MCQTFDIGMIGRIVYILSGSTLLSQVPLSHYLEAYDVLVTDIKCLPLNDLSFEHMLPPNDLEHRPTSQKEIIAKLTNI